MDCFTEGDRDFFTRKGTQIFHNLPLYTNVDIDVTHVLKSPSLCPYILAYIQTAYSLNSQVTTMHGHGSLIRSQTYATSSI